MQAGHSNLKSTLVRHRTSCIGVIGSFRPFKLIASSVVEGMRCLNVSWSNSLALFNLIWEIKVVTVFLELLFPHEVFSCYCSCISIFISSTPSDF